MTEKKTTSIKKTNLKDKVIKSLEITEARDINRHEGGVCKFIDMGVINPQMVIVDNERQYTVYNKNTGKNELRTKVSKVFDIEKRNLIRKWKGKLREDLGDDYKKLTIETRLFKPRFGATGEQCKFKFGVYVFGEGFERIIRKIGKNKNIVLINE